MRRLTLIIVSSIAALVLGGCSEEGSPPSPRGNQVNLLVVTEGTIRLKREGWNDYVPVAFGAVVRPRDLVEVDGSALLLCADLSLKPITISQVRQPCPVEGGWLEYNGGRFDSGQRGSASEVPYILYPRNTLVMDPRPLLRWRDTGADSYTVSIVSGGEQVWSQSGVGGGEIQYPDDAPTLRPGSDYLLVVQDDDGNSSQEDPARGLGFQVVGEAKRAAIVERRDEILALDGLDEPARRLALAVYYAGLDLEGGRGPWGDAWLLLESVARAQDTPAVRLLLGDMSAATKLPDEAKTAYQAALQGAEALGDLESQAAAHAGLWRVTGDAGHRDRALELYQVLGDEAAVEGLAE